MPLQEPRARHCEERSDEAIQGPPRRPGLLRFARNDEGGLLVRAAVAIALLAGLWTAPLAAREAVEASAPVALAVTLYRDPNRGVNDLSRIHI